MKKITLVLSFILLSSTISFAQENTYKTTLAKMMELSGAQTTYKTVINQMVTMYKQQKTNIPVAFWDEFESLFIKNASADLLDMLLPVYQRHLTEADLKNMIAFYQTPTGKKFAEKTPLITQESMASGEEWGRKLGAEIAKKLQEKGYE